MSKSIQVTVLNAKSKKEMLVTTLSENDTVADLKKQIQRKKSYLYSTRQMIRSEPTGKGLKDEDKLAPLAQTADNLTLYFKDLGPQVGWTTVFLTEYAGPLFVYLIFYARPALIYGNTKPLHNHYVVDWACYAWVFHYAKRLLETIFVHRFSNATMPIMNIFKNSFYYWGFAALVSYYINHPLYTPASFGNIQIYIGMIGFLINELGNLSIHIALRNLRPAGSKVRRIPYPTANPMTILFDFVSCPNYTYEIGSWIFFTIMAQSVAALLFTIAGAYQMTIWALGKHRNYKREFQKYPRGRKAIIPLFI